MGDARSISLTTDGWRNEDAHTLRFSILQNSAQSILLSQFRSIAPKMSWSRSSETISPTFSKAALTSSKLSTPSLFVSTARKAARICRFRSADKASAFGAPASAEAHPPMEIHFLNHGIRLAGLVRLGDGYENSHKKGQSKDSAESDSQFRHTPRAPPNICTCVTGGSHLRFVRCHVSDLLTMWLSAES